ncbi:non-canonical purine NTP pyrophosphatase [Candidatus Woesearchaeota archaeon]|nr:non-canonical purine NTP pyrophosphatase [Candidatus Woesearchaeota archaeon]
MRIYFVTTNKHKFQEVKDILKDYPIELEQLDMSYEEDHDLSMEGIAKKAAKKLADELQKPIVLEDTGLFFEAYEGFPGALPKFVINSIGFKGIFKLLNGESRKAYFKTVAAFCEPGKEPVLFEGIMNGIITEKVHNPEKDEMPYDKIFVPEGYDKTISEIPFEEKKSYSQRGKAFRKFGEYIKKHKI